MAKRTLILGTGALAVGVAFELLNRHQRDYRLIGVIGSPPAASGAFPCRWLGPIAELNKIISECAVQRIVLALQETSESLPTELLIEAQSHRHIVIETASETLEKLTGRVAADGFTESAFLFDGSFRRKPLSSALSRAISLAFAGVGLMISLPLMGMIATAICLDSRGPALFVQDRIGRGGKRFRLLKFRSMTHGTQKRSEWAPDNAEDITRVGALIRKFRLDELPQFMNVIRGDMNIVGPRPHPLSNRELFTLVARNMAHNGAQIPCYSLRQSVRPGITGWAQVSYKYASALDEEIEKLMYDLYYVKHYSPWLDMEIMLKTIKVVLFGHASTPSNTDLQPPPTASTISQTPSDVAPLLASLPREVASETATYRYGSKNVHHLREAGNQGQ
jgi:lipopolysaccharide/colanic/teichoic acid biosynthesis glycosyltransferase